MDPDTLVPAVHDEVRVFNGTRDCPDEGYPGEVVTVGRVFVYISYGRVGSQPVAFDKATRRVRNGTGWGTWWLTLAEVDERARLRKAWAVLRDHGLIPLVSAKATDLPLEALEAIGAILTALDTTANTDTAQEGQ